MFTLLAAEETGLLGGALTNLESVGSKMDVSTMKTNLPNLIGAFINVGLGITGVVLIVFFVMAGYNYFTSQGDKDKIEKAKKIMTNAVIGLVIIVAAYAISSFVIDALNTALTKTS